MDLSLLDLKDTYRTSEDNLLADFYEPCLANSICYDRAVGFFNSSILQHISQGLYQFITNGGSMRLITGVQLSKKDIEDIKKGYEIREVIERELTSELDSLIFDEHKSPDVYNLFWLIKEGRLDIKVCNRLVDGSFNGAPNVLFHEKFGIFRDDRGNAITFSGSVNESTHGWIYNFESFDTNWSWNEFLVKRVETKINYFEDLWSDVTSGVQVFDFPQALKERIIKVAPSEPVQRVASVSIKPILKKPEARPYQKDAYKAWKLSNYRGLFEMATGTGKTITALYCTDEYLKNHKQTFVVIVVPYQHLVDQWADEISKFGWIPIKCYQSRDIWETKLKDEVVSFNIGLSNMSIALATATTASSDEFLDCIDRIRGQALLIADEAHNLGAQRRQTILSEKFTARIGLSATPDRWFDEEGTAILRNYFGESVYTYDLQKAINNGVLTPYEYHPILIELTEDEFKKYEEITSKIIKLVNQGLEEDNETVSRLLIKRASILNSAENKLPVFFEILKKNMNLKHSLVYVSPEQIQEVMRGIQESGQFFQKFTAKEKLNERRQILSLFQNGEVPLIVAMHCLDEGVDVPATQIAYILASSTNPREFVQRRGRVLRRYPGKEKAIIYDLITVPPLTANSLSCRSILKKEFARFKEFSDLALNQFQAKAKILELANIYNLLDEV